MNAILEMDLTDDGLYLKVKNLTKKSKSFRANQALYMSKVSGKVIMRRSSLETKYFKTRSNDSFMTYKKHKN